MPTSLPAPRPFAACAGPGVPNPLYCQPPQTGAIGTDPYNKKGEQYGVTEKSIPPVMAFPMLPRLGLAFAHWAGDLLWSFRPPMFNHAGFRMDLDSRVLVFNLSVSLLTGLGFGLAPAIRATRSDLATDLKERASAPAGFHRVWHPRAVLVMAQCTDEELDDQGAALKAIMATLAIDE